MRSLSRRRRHRLWPGVTAALLCLILLQVRGAGGAAPFSNEKAPFRVSFKKEISPYRVLGVFVLPEESLTLEVLEHPGKDYYLLQASGGEVVPIALNKWQWKAPAEAGLYPVVITDSRTGDAVTLNCFVMIPHKRLQGEYLNGYRIGKYPSILYKRLPIYTPPRGFVEVTRENQETLVAPHFRLKQFLCKQEGDYPRYLVLRERLLLKLELILEKVNERGYRCDSFNILSGYRTPYYNKLIGNVKYSRHLWGGAADIFIDEDPKDDMMDDLNRDGRIDYRDATVLYDIVDSMYGKTWYESFVGGLGRYKKTASHGPFVHVDVRGFHARWGL